MSKTLTLHLVGRPPLHQPNQVAHRELRWDRHKHVDMINRQHAPDNINATFVTDLSDDVAHAQSNITQQNLVAILGRPDEMIAMVVNAVLAGGYSKPI